MKYKTQPWFALLASACERMSRKEVAQALGVSAPQISQVLNGSGKYGTGEAGTDNLAEKVIHTFGRYPCPHLSAQSGFGDRSVEVTAEECRAYAHRPAPTGSPRDMQHWQACNSCPHKAHTAPPAPREVKPRKARSDSNNKEST
jgi:transcriptional regulator with XRE-family HTH domain